MKLNFREDFPEIASRIDRLARPSGPEDCRALEAEAMPASMAADLAAFYKEALDEAAIVEITDGAGTILSVNDRFCEVSGYARGELVGSHHRMLRSGLHDRAFFQQMLAELACGRVWHGEICNRAKSGDLYWVDTTIVPHRRQGGRIERFMAIRFDITARKQAEERLQLHATTDGLTDLPNLQSFVRDVTAIATGIEAATGRVAVGILDIDHFREINDSLGYRAGNRLLREFAARLRTTMRPGDEIARLGGDEFGLILRDCASEADIRLRVDGIVEAFAAPLQAGETERVLSASMGAVMVPAGGACRAELLRNAEIALYEAKANGRGRVELFDDAMHEDIQRRAELRDAFERGLRIGEFVVHYQPIVPLRGDAPMAMEALLRWNHPELGLIRPPQFIEALTDEHLAAQVGGYVLREVIGQIREWRAADTRFASIAVNATLGDFRSRRFVDTILAAIANEAMAPSDICVEINEDVLVGRGGGCARVEINRLHAAGVSIAFDDFGTGFASLRHLRDLPIDIVKIDKGFIRAIVDDRADRAIVGNVIALAHSLGKSVTAEGVESPEQARVLESLDCDRIQGFLIAKAIPPRGIEAILQSKPPIAIEFGLAD
ncbi:bifunctional diguanylate cyclase/phosphodiesterase [Novosphingobium sp. G106]|uniref:putative bifunctional diguanylate cyclase/phosphodiesterase n=1 Tax=Novosphingobium sp. G106 TaxID=2849500 RepID=UPI001C2D5C21|nr:bifunctional diguanylate cyclase/phosphodiesterase [Novosphingobium sp. G106]MBV1688785.1 bifunctional diguanylate cyclase/phosphodiesterase [Novosphingobium sp. G106]